ncbi:Helix-turn-helix domain protein [compost metagenome]
MDLLTTEQLAERLQVSAEHIRRMTAAGELPHLRLGARERRYELPAVLDALRVAREPDADSVAAFAEKMRERMLAAGEAGRTGWQDAELDDLWLALVRALADGSPVDVANYCMMIEERGDQLSGALERWSGRVLWERRDQDYCRLIESEAKSERIVAAASQVVQAWQSETGSITCPMDKLAEALSA